MEAQFIGYGIAKGLSDMGFWMSITLLLVLAPTMWRAPKCECVVFRPEPRTYPAPNITSQALEHLSRFPASDHLLFDSSREAPLKQLWAIDLRNFIETRVAEQRSGDSHFLINTVSAVIAPFSDELPVFLLAVLVNDGSTHKIHITAQELQEVFPCLAGIDWRKIVHVGNLAQVLRDLAPIIQYEETLRKISSKN